MNHEHDASQCDVSGMKPECLDLFTRAMSEQADNLNKLAGSYAQLDKTLALLQADLKSFINLYDVKHGALAKEMDDIKHMLIGDKGVYERIKLNEAAAAVAANRVRDEAMAAAEKVKVEALAAADKMKQDADSRLTTLEHRQIWISGAAAGAGFVLAKAWDWFTAIGGGTHHP